ncbi:hypothetical protein, partial [Escherichia coli]|uniref:hypothetical protein n=1 Tax=Escherichia coli TaxID=562 RepID=UPI003F47DD3E
PFPVVIPLHQAVSQTLLTRPPLVSEAASCFLLPFDLHVLGLPPAFNLSHDQTLQLPFPVVIPLHQAVSQTLLTRPPLVSETASCFLLPFDLHVLGLPPAFNLSHDQTLQ